MDPWVPEGGFDPRDDEEKSEEVKEDKEGEGKDDAQGNEEEERDQGIHGLSLEILDCRWYNYKKRERTYKLR